MQTPRIQRPPSNSRLGYLTFDYDKWLSVNFFREINNKCLLELMICQCFWIFFYFSKHLTMDTSHVKQNQHPSRLAQTKQNQRKAKNVLRGVKNVPRTSSSSARKKTQSINRNKLTNNIIFCQRMNREIHQNDMQEIFPIEQTAGVFLLSNDIIPGCNQFFEWIGCLYHKRSS